MRRQSSRWTGLLAALFSLGILGCATVFGSTSQLVTVETDPEGARVVDYPSGDSFVSPVEIELDKRTTHRLVISKDGYRTVEFKLRREVQPHWWVMGAFTLGLSIAIDGLTGALIDIKPDYIYVPLEPDAPLGPE